MHPSGLTTDFVRSARWGLWTAVGLLLLAASPAEAAAKSRKKAPRAARPAVVEPEPAPELPDPPPEPIAEPPPPPPPPAVVAPPEERAPTGLAAPEPVWLELALGAGLGARHFAYQEPLTANLRPYELSGTPLLSASATLLPFASSGSLVPRIFGLEGSYQRALGLTSKAPNGEALDTTWQRVDVALLAQVTPGYEEDPSLRPSLGVTMSSFTFDGGGGLEAELPAVDYKAMRAALGARFPGPVTLELEAAWLFALDAGPVADRFPQATVGGFEAIVGGRAALSEALSLGLVVGYERWFYDLQPEPGDAYVAGGALDELLTLRLQLGWELR